MGEKNSIGAHSEAAACLPSVGLSVQVAGGRGAHRGVVWATSSGGGGGMLYFSLYLLLWEPGQHTHTHTRGAYGVSGFSKMASLALH